jgi:hypothetical protein
MYTMLSFGSATKMFDSTLSRAENVGRARAEENRRWLERLAWWHPWKLAQHGGQSLSAAST